MNTQRKVRLSLGDSLKILGPYVYENFFEQLKTIWFIVAYLLLFQILVLGLPIVHAIMIGVGIGIDVQFWLSRVRQDRNTTGVVSVDTGDKSIVNGRFAAAYGFDW